MRTFLKKLVQLSEPVELLETQRFKNEVKALQDQYLRLALHPEGPPEKTDEDIATRRQLRSAAMFYELILLKDMDLTASDVRDAIDLAATVFEFLGRTTSDAEYEEWFTTRGIIGSTLYGPANDFLRAGLLFALSGKPANGSLVLDKLIRKLRLAPIAERMKASGVILSCFKLIAYLIGGRPEDLERALRTGIQLKQRRARQGTVLRPRYRVFEQISDAALVLVRECLGVSSSDGTSDEYLEAALGSASLAREPGLAWLAHTVGYVIKHLHLHSVETALGKYSFPRQYLDSLISTGHARLWPSQMVALNKGLLSSRSNFVIESPTGSGKSLLAELTIVKELDTLLDGWCLYLAPSRALVRQVERDLKRRLIPLDISVRSIVAGSERNAFTDDEVSVVVAGRGVTVLTPEKLETYLRFSPQLFDSCRLCIVDEAQLLGNEQRGYRLELLLALMRTKNPKLRIVCFSAVLSNSEDLARWLGNPDANVKADWRPTRQLKGLLVKNIKTKSEISPHVQVKRGNKWISTVRSKSDPDVKVRLRKVEYYDLGLILVRDQQDLSQIGRRLTIPSLASATRVENAARKGRGWGSWKKDNKTTSAPNLAVQVSKRLLSVSDHQLLFFTTPASAVSQAQELSSYLAKVDKLPPRPALRELIKTVKSLEQDDILVRCLRTGVAYHHSGMSTVLKRLIEVAAKKKTIRIICATSTLQEGLNIPAEIAIITGGKYFSEETPNKREEMSVSNFENIAGRAGRAFVSTEGLVIFVPEDYHKVGTSFQRKFMYASDDDLRIESVLASILQEFDSPPQDHLLLDHLSKSSQVVLLALNAIGLIGQDELERFVSNCWGGIELPREAWRRIGSNTSRAIGHFRTVFGEEKLHLFGQTGLSIEGCQVIYDSLLTMSANTDAYQLRPEGQLNTTLVKQIVTAVMKAPELWEHMKWNDLPAEVHSELVVGWLEQQNPSRVIASPKLRSNLSRRPTVGDLMRYYGSLEQTMAWGFGVAFLFLNHILGEDVDRELGALPLYLKHGVDSLEGAFVSLLGVSDRVSAKALGRLYRSTNDSVSLREVETWLGSISSSDVENALPGQRPRQAVVLDDLGLDAHPYTPTVVVAQLMMDRVPDTDYVVVVAEGPHIFAKSLVGEHLGRLQPSLSLDELLSRGPCFGILLSRTGSKVMVQVRLHTRVAQSRRI